MTVPAFSPPAVLPGAPPPSIGAGAAALTDKGGLFEGLLVGALQAERDGALATAAAPDDQTPVEVANTGETTPTVDAGAMLMMFAPAAAPLAVPTPAQEASTGESGAPAGATPAITGLGGDAVGATRPPVANDIPDVLSLATTGDIIDTATQEEIQAPVRNGQLGDLAGLTAKAGERDPVAPKVVAQVASPPVAVAAQPAAQSAAVAPALVAPAAVAPTAPATATASDIETVEAAAGATPLPVSAKATSTDGDSRRAPGAARAERRDLAARNGAASTGPFAPKSDLLATPIAATTGPVTGETEVGTDAAPELVALDTAEAPETGQPSVIAETRAQTTQATAAAIDAAAVRGSPETVAKMAADIVRKLDGQSTRFDLQLDPLGMGKVDVAIEIDRDGKLTAAMSFDSARSASDLRGRAGELRQALEQAGFDIAEGGLTFDLSGQGAGFSGRETGQQARAWNGRAFQRAQSGADEADLSLAATPSTPSRWTRSGVDIRI